MEIIYSKSENGKFHVLYVEDLDISVCGRSIKEAFSMLGEHIESDYKAYALEDDENLDTHSIKFKNKLITIFGK